ncbi:MAG: endonuclease V [Nanoarchaeota archaeon]
MEELKKEQLGLAKKVSTTNELNPEKLTTVGGTDQIIVGKGVMAVISVFTYPQLQEIEKKYATTDITQRYNPGYSFYNEGSAIIEAFKKLEHKPDLLLVKGDGILHPRRIGIASHVGLELDIPTIGVAKAMLCGSLQNDTVVVQGEPRGKLLVTKKVSNPIFISPGHKIGLDTSITLIKTLIIPPHKMPEPIAVSHKFLTKLKKFQKDKED